MPRVLCKCGNILNESEIPNPIAFVFTSDVDFDQYPQTNTRDEIYRDMSVFLKCDICERLWFYWQDGILTSYAKE